jgi:hypothetical protein
MWTGIEIKLHFKKKKNPTQTIETNPTSSENRSSNEINHDTNNAQLQEKDAKKENYNNQFL